MAVLCHISMPFGKKYKIESHHSGQLAKLAGCIFLPFFLSELHRLHGLKLYTCHNFAEIDEKGIDRNKARIYNPFHKMNLINWVN